MNYQLCQNNNLVRATRRNGTQAAVAERIEARRWVAHYGSDGKRAYASTAIEAIHALLGLVVVARIESVDFVAVMYNDGSVEYQDKVKPVASAKPVQNYHREN